MIGKLHPLLLKWQIHSPTLHWEMKLNCHRSFDSIFTVDLCPLFLSGVIISSILKHLLEESFYWKWCRELLLVTRSLKVLFRHLRFEKLLLRAGKINWEIELSYSLTSLYFYCFKKRKRERKSWRKLKENVFHYIADHMI